MNALKLILNVLISINKKIFAKDVTVDTLYWKISAKFLKSMINSKSKTVLLTILITNVFNVLIGFIYQTINVKTSMYFVKHTIS